MVIVESGQAEIPEHVPLTDRAQVVAVRLEGVVELLFRGGAVELRWRLCGLLVRVGLLVAEYGHGRRVANSSGHDRTLTARARADAEVRITRIVLSPCIIKAVEHRSGVN